MIVNVCFAFDSFKDCVTSRDLSFQLSHIFSFRTDLQITVFPVAVMHDPLDGATPVPFNEKGVYRILQLVKKYGKRPIIGCGRREFKERLMKEIRYCTVYNLSTIFKHQEISQKKTFEQLEQLKEQIITSVTS